MHTLHCFAGLAALVFSAGAAAGETAPPACSMAVATRARDVAQYVENGTACVRTLPPGYWWDYTAENMFLTRINEERVRAGAAPLALRHELGDSARFMSLDMGVNRFFSHASPDGRNFSDRISAFDRSALTMYASENIAQRTSDHYQISARDAEELHTALMNSPGHRKNILNPEASHVAIGVLRHRDGIWVTQIFIGLSGTLSEALPLRIRGGETLAVKPNVPGWVFKTFRGEPENGAKFAFEAATTTPRLKPGVTGNVNLLVLTEKAGPTTREASGATRSIMYSQELGGPDFLAEPHGS
jgi:uncharacterized protein YkwD